MSTRGAYGFRLNGRDKLTYNHSDSYPTGLGVEVARLLARTTKTKLIPIVERIKLVEDNDENYRRLRDTQGDLRAYLDGLTEMIDNKKFLTDSLFCEWAYIINLDTGRLEVYEGYNKDPKARGRYANAKPPDERGYVGVAMVADTPFRQVTQKYLAELEREK